MNEREIFLEALEMTTPEARAAYQKALELAGSRDARRRLNGKLR